MAAAGPAPPPATVEQARARHPAIDVRLGSATALPFDDGALAGYRADKVLHQVPDPVRAVAEARRALAPGGRFVAVGQDWDLIGVADDDPARSRALVHAQADALPGGNVIRRLPELLADGGFDGIAVEAHAWAFTDVDLIGPLLGTLAATGTRTGAVSAEDADRWLAGQRARGLAGRLLIVVPVLVVSATRP